MTNLTETQRIGALVPATNPVVEPDFYRVVPPEITVHLSGCGTAHGERSPKLLRIAGTG